MSSRTNILRSISDEYYDLNGTHILSLDKPPTALEFSRLVHIGRPVTIKNAGVVPSRGKWTDEYLIEKIGDRKISVAVTPDGRADSVTIGRDGRPYFVEPSSEKMTMADFISKFHSGTAIDPGITREVFYLQSQNGNIYPGAFFNGRGGDISSEFAQLREDVPAEIEWCSEALGKHPDAVNLWIGDSKSITSIHNDPYENVYTVVRGSKHFTLLPPTEGWCMQEQIYPHATYTRGTHGLELTPSPSNTVRWSSVLDPDAPGVLPAGAHPIRVTLHEGDTLYLPAGWWHYVRQGEPEGGDGVTIALNWWYDMEMRGMGWVWLSFLRGMNASRDEFDGAREPLSGMASDISDEND